jgi:hypothetical protein
MIKATILDDTLTEITASKNLGDIGYPYDEDIQLYLRNDGTNNLLRVSISPNKAISVCNFSDPPLIEEVIIEDVESPIYFYYAELLFIANDVCMDIFNAPGRKVTISRDTDGYVRNIWPNISVKFHHTLSGGNARLLYSEAFYYSKIAKDNSGVPDTYTDKIKYLKIIPGESVPFWLNINVKENFESIKNPYVLNLLVRGEDNVTYT